MARRRFWTRPTLLAASGAALAVAVVVTVLTFTLPGFLSRDYDAKSLASLRKQAVRTRQEFAEILASLEARKSRFAGKSLPADAAAFFPLFREAGLDTENEGLALSNGDGFIEVWYGNVLSLADQIGRDDIPILRGAKGSVLIRSKASVFVVALQPLGEAGGRMLVHFTRLAFLPRVRSTYIREFHALRPGPRAEFDIDYWDFREDVEGFEKFFARHKDEFTGQPRQENEIQTLFFPLRNESGSIVATATLASPSLTSRLTVAREDLHLVLLLALLAAGLAALAFLWSSPGFRRGGDVLSGAVGAALLVGLRVAALPLGQLERVQSLRLFQPAVAGFVSWRGLTQSPADILLTALALLGLAACLSAMRPRETAGAGRPAAGPLERARRRRRRGPRGRRSARMSEIVRRFVFNSNLSLLRWDFDVPRMVLQLGLFVVLGAFLLALAVVFRTILRDPRRILLFGLSTALGAAAAILAGKGPSILLAIISAALMAWVFAAAAVPGLARRREIGLAGLVLAALWLSRSVDDLSFARTHRLLETTVAHTVLTQETWGNFLIEETLPGLDRNERQIVAFFKDPQDREFAHALWERSPVAKSNWYSSLELRDAEGNTLSRFSLNVPKVLGGPPELEPAEDWTIVPYGLTFIGKQKDYLIGYKDYAEEGVRLGRVVLYVSLDPEMLPFLYSANPYFEVLRTDSLPSLRAARLRLRHLRPRGPLALQSRAS